MDNRLLQDFVQAADSRGLGLFGVAVQQGGRFLAEHRWVEDRPHVLHSLSKSYTSMAIGMALDAGKLELGQKVISFFPQELPNPLPPMLEDMTVRDLLIMAPGHDTPLMMSHQRGRIDQPNWVRYYLAQPLDREPGQRFVYDSACTYMLSAIFQTVMGETVLDYLTPRLFAPMGIARPYWQTCPRGITLGCAGLYLRTREILPLGTLCLGEGKLDGRQIVPAWYVREATSKQIENGGVKDGGSGYGYQFWMNHHTGYRGDGAYGQLCIVLPEREAVIAINADHENIQEILDTVWECLEPRL